MGFLFLTYSSSYKVISGKEAFIEKLSWDIYKGLKPIEEECAIEQLYTLMEERQREMMDLVRLSVKTTIIGIYEKEHLALAGELESVRNQMQKLKEQQAARALRENQVEELKDYLMARETHLTKFDEDLFRRMVEKVKIQSMAEVAFVFKAGVEAREIL
ncbi:MAG: hypothetical protein ACYCVD_08780 [Desulfitobacteriaceae bacterium]